MNKDLQQHEIPYGRLTTPGNAGRKAIAAVIFFNKKASLGNSLV